jgi:MYXO-CTERM domain-containing protein
VCFGGTPALAFAPTDPTFTATMREVQVQISHPATGEPIRLTGASIDPAGAFTLAVEPSWPTTVATAETVHLTVRFTATTPGTHSATLNLHASTCADQPFALLGRILAPVTPPAQEPGGGGGGGGGCGCGAAGAGWWALLGVLLLPLRGRPRRRRTEAG